MVKLSQRSMKAFGSSARLDGEGPPAAVVGALFVILAISAGVGFYGIPVIAADLIARGGLSPAAGAIGSSVFLLASGAGGLLAARLLNSIGARTLLAAGAVGMAGYIAGIGFMPELWMLWLLFAMGGVAFACVSLVPASTVVVAWFGTAAARPLALATKRGSRWAACWSRRCSPWLSSHTDCGLAVRWWR